MNGKESTQSRKKIVYCLLFRSLALLICLLLISRAEGKLTEPLSITGGTIVGKWEKGVALFNGIPYAAPPIDSLRWRPPQPVIPWRGIKKTTKFSSWAMQMVSDEESAYIQHMAKGIGHNWFMQHFVPFVVRVLPKAPENEDCLYLNVRTGNMGKREKVPVMVWIHGGAKQFGSGAETYYHSNALIEKGVIVVTINYRLGIFGYFAHPELAEESPHGSSGNYGLLDQIAALEWVQNNIEVFGGDPNNVTLAGESSGGEAVAELMASPLARGLFHKAIIQSGSITTVSEMRGSPVLYQKEAEEAGEKWATAVGLPDLKSLRATSAQKLLSLQKNYTYEYAYPYQTVLVDSWVMPQSIVHAFRDGKQAKVPLLIGYNADEGTIMYPISEHPTPSNWANNVPKDASGFGTFMQEIYGDDGDSLITLYGLDNPNMRLDGEMAMRGDDVTGVHALYLCNQMERSNLPSYFYFFTRTPVSKKQTVGAYHFAEIPFLFGTHDIFFKANKADRLLGQAIQSYWTSFMKEGNPNTESLPLWPVYSQNEAQWLNLNHTIKAEPLSRREKLFLLEKTLLRKIAESDSLTIKVSQQ